MNTTRPSGVCPLAVAAIALTLGACSAGRIHPLAADPLGWPAHMLSDGGFALEDSEVPIAAEVGALVARAGRLLESPALLVEGVLTMDAARLGESVEALVGGVGETLTAAINVPFSLVIGPRIDLGRDADLINDALAALDEVDLGEARELLPAGTRVRASGRNLIWDIPGRGDVLQRAEGSWLFYALTSLPGQERFIAQERSWGFVVPDRSVWDAYSDRQRAVTTMHEMWHQFGQIETMFGGWSLAYWPAYHASFMTSGWGGHWAETGPRGAATIERALRFWNLPQSTDGESADEP